MQRIQRIAIGTIVVGVVVLAMKAAAWWMTGSAALYSDALESVVNVVASLVASGALWLSAKPADANHPYGHAKAEFFSAVIEGTLIIAAALSILHHAWAVWREPAVLIAPWLALTLTAVSTAINAGWAVLLLTRQGGRTLGLECLVAGCEGARGASRHWSCFVSSVACRSADGPCTQSV